MVELKRRPYFRLNQADRTGFAYGKPKLYVFLWFLVQDTLFRFSPIPCYVFRNWLLRRFGAQVGKGVKVRPRVRVHYPWRVTIGDYTSIGDDAWLYSIAPISIGSHSIISQKSFLCTSGHDYTDPYFKTTAAAITVGSGVWIAADVFIAPGVIIGDNAVIGARSTVLHDMPAGMLCYGHPCKVIKRRV